MYECLPGITYFYKKITVCSKKKYCVSEGNFFFTKDTVPKNFNKKNLSFTKKYLPTCIGKYQKVLMGKITKT